MSSDIEDSLKLLENLKPSIEKARIYLSKYYFDDETKDLNDISLKVEENVRSYYLSSISLTFSDYSHIYYTDASDGSKCPDFPGLKIRSGTNELRKYIFQNIKTVKVVFNNGTRDNSKEISIDKPGVYLLKDDKLILREDENQFKDDYIEIAIERARSNLSKSFFNDSEHPLTDIVDKVHQKYGPITGSDYKPNLTNDNNNININKDVKDNNTNTNPVKSSVGVDVGVGVGVGDKVKDRDRTIIHTKRLWIHVWDTDIGANEWPGIEIKEKDLNGWGIYSIKSPKFKFLVHKGGFNEEQKSVDFSVQEFGEYWIGDDNNLLREKP